MKGKLTVLMITAFVDMLGLAMIIPLLPFYATKLGASATVVGVLIAAFSIAQLASAPLWGRFSDRYGRTAGASLSDCWFPRSRTSSSRTPARSGFFSSPASCRGSEAERSALFRRTSLTPATPMTARRVSAGCPPRPASARSSAPQSARPSFTGAATRPESRRRSSAFWSACLPASTCASHARR